MRSDLIIKKEAYKALNSKLSTLEIERFIFLINSESFNYTEWRKTLFQDLSLDQLLEQANHFSEGLSK